MTISERIGQEIRHLRSELTSGQRGRWEHRELVSRVVLSHLEAIQMGGGGARWLRQEVHDLVKRLRRMTPGIPDDYYGYLASRIERRVLRCGSGARSVA